MIAPGHGATRAGRSSARVVLAFLLVTGLLVLAACSSGGSAASPDSATDSRVISIDLLDFRFEPAVVDVRLGESVQFVAVNHSDLSHELFIGSSVEQDQHHALHATAPPDMQNELDEGTTGIYVPARGTAQLTYRFDHEGDVVMGCHLIGHFEAGMHGVIRVTAN